MSNHKVNVFALTAITLLIITTLSAFATASIIVGVKEGDWIEYNVKLTQPANTEITHQLTPDHNITWARMQITSINGPQITLNILTRYENTTEVPDSITLNLETGVLGDDFIIPANLNQDDMFFDINQGNITIKNVTQRFVAGAQRNVICGSTQETSYCWDQATGVLINAQTTLPSYIMTTNISSTNMWQIQSTSSTQNTPNPSLQPFELDSSATFALIIGAIALIIIIISSIILRRKSNKK